MEVSSTQDKYVTGIIGAVSLLSLLAVKLAAFATADVVWVLGYETHIGCWFKDAFHAPCPFCGMTRSVVLTLQGDLPAAFRLNAAGPPIIFGTLALGIGMLFLSFAGGAARPSGASNNYGKKILTAAAIYFSLVALFSVAYWILRLLGYFPPLPELL
jgi:hypothetical protein